MIRMISKAVMKSMTMRSVMMRRRERKRISSHINNGEMRFRRRGSRRERMKRKEDGTLMMTMRTLAKT